MKILKKTPFLEGTAMSDELTSIGKQIGVYLEYAGKIARVNSEQQALIKTEKPAGQEIFLKAVELEEAKRDGKKLSQNERKKLEKQTKFDLSPKKLGNPTPMFNIVMNEITSENKHWHDLIDLARKEIERLCTQTGAMTKLDDYDVRNDL